MYSVFRFSSVIWKIGKTWPYYGVIEYVLIGDCIKIITKWDYVNSS